MATLNTERRRDLRSASVFRKKIPDGMSKTVLVGEAVIGDGSDSRLSGWATVTGYDWYTVPQD